MGDNGYYDGSTLLHCPTRAYTLYVLLISFQARFFDPTHHTVFPLCWHAKLISHSFLSFHPLLHLGKEGFLIALILLDLVRFMSHKIHVSVTILGNSILDAMQ